MNEEQTMKNQQQAAVTRNASGSSPPNMNAQPSLRFGRRHRRWTISRGGKGWHIHDAPKELGDSNGRSVTPLRTREDARFRARMLNRLEDAYQVLVDHNATLAASAEGR